MALAAGAGPAVAATEPIWVVLSDNSWAYTEAAGTLQAEWGQGIEGRDMLFLTAKDLPTGVPPSAIITLGSAALRSVMQRVNSVPEWSHVPVLAALVPRDGFAAIWKHPPAWVSAVYLDQPVERYLDLIRQSFPGLTRVGVMLGSDSSTLEATLTKAATDRGLRLVTRQVSKPDAMYDTLRSVLADSDVLLVLPDGVVTDTASIQNVLIMAYRQRIPVVSYSPGLVKAGATLGLYASPAQVGQQVAAILKAQPSWQNGMPPRLADTFTIAVNEQVCKSLGLTVPKVSDVTEAIRRKEGRR
ncbi:MAG TPA: ABC transporter substrate binding protein [Aquabacterium sp.]|nr:ABC transporter substrate binding protein [Aquabacterium sp.]